MIIYIECKEFKECTCGNTPREYSIGYGRTPYNLFCKCGKSLFHAKCEITGSVNNLISYWNNRLRNISIEDIKKETKKFQEEREELIKIEGYNPKEYQYYWIDNKEVLIQRW